VIAKKALAPARALTLTRAPALTLSLPLTQVVTKEGAYYLQWRELEPEQLAQAGPAPGPEEGWSDGVKLVGAGKQVGEATLHRT